MSKGKNVITVDFRNSQEITYTVRKWTSRTWIITKFGDDGSPLAEYNVVQTIGTDKGFYCDCPGFRRQKYDSQSHKHIKLVKEFIRQGEPTGRVYALDQYNDPIVMYEFDPNAFDPSD